MNDKTLIQQWVPSKKLGALTLVLLVVLFSLGVWQLERAHWRAAQWDQLESTRTQSPVSISREYRVEAYQRVTAEGRFTGFGPYYLMNRTRGGQSGVEVFSLFLTEGGALIAVNRGFTPWAYTGDLPAVVEPTQRSIIGYIAPRDENPVFDAAPEPKRLQSRDLGQLSEIVGYPVVAEVRLAPEHPDALMAEWQSIMMKPEKHVGYAIQWFSLAVALLILYVVFAVKITRKNGEVHAQSS